MSTDDSVTSDLEPRVHQYVSKELPTLVSIDGEEEDSPAFP